MSSEARRPPESKLRNPAAGSSRSMALPAVVRPPGIGEGAQRFEEDDPVGLLARVEEVSDSNFSKVSRQTPPGTNLYCVTG